MIAAERNLVQEIMTPGHVKALPRELLPKFCEELRQALIQIISTTGGHIGVNLGIVELTVALYRVFDFPTDSLIWDIGHQVYIQKMLTGRLPLLRQIRKNGGSPGYAFRPESEYDRVTSSHAGASISLALGVAIANRLHNEPATSIAVIGDGSLVEGSSQEALNHLAVEQGKLLVIINDNEMALDRNFGGIHEYLKKLQPQGKSRESYFSTIGIPFAGTRDGHDVLGLVDTFEELQASLDRPTILHVKTIKGKGLEQMAEKSPVRIHWNFPFEPATGKNTEGPKGRGYAAFAAEAIEAILEQDKNAVLVTPATLQNTGTYNAFCKYPERSFDVSLAEQHALTLAGGMALEGLKPIVCFEATFFQRAFDQLVHDICINNLPVLTILARTGHTGLDHLTHHSLFDLAYLRCVPNLRIVVSPTHKDLGSLIKNEYQHLKQPTLVLFPYGNVLDDPTEDFATDQKPLVRSAGAKGLLLSVGTQNKNALELKKLLTDEGVHFDHLAVTQIEPLADAILEATRQYPYIVTMEEYILQGGLGSLILETLQAQQAQAKTARIGFPKKFIEHGTRDYIYKKYKIDAASVLQQLREQWPELWKGQA